MLHRKAARRLSVCMEGPASSITAERQTGALYGEVKDALSIPVIASGDVVDAATGMSMLTETGCDMVMIGRGALGNPWVFRGTRRCLQRPCHSSPSVR